MSLKAPTGARWMAAAAAALALCTPWVGAAETEGIFDKIQPSFRDRAFMRISYINANVKTTSKDAYDVTGPVVGKNDIATYLTGNRFTSKYLNTTPSASRTSAIYNTISGNFTQSLELDAVACPAVTDGLGTPCGIRSRGSSTVGTAALSLGYYLDDEMSWVVEAFVLAAPLKISAYGDGSASAYLNGKNIINVKMLPPTAVLGKYFGEAKDTIRPFVGFGASYAFFFDVQATDTLNTFQGGRSPGDTSVKLKNAFGVGPFVGLKGQLDDTWHVSLNVGKLRYKTDATLVTRNTTITNESDVIKAFGPNTQAAVVALDAPMNRRPSPNPGDPGYLAPLTILMCDLADAKAGLTASSNNCSSNFGTFVRKAPVVFDNTLFMLSVGRSF